MKFQYKALTYKALVVTHAYCHLLADVHLAGFAPAFTLSQGDSEYARKPQVPIASVVVRLRKNLQFLLKITQAINQENKLNFS
jgi:hypothetical protein